MIMTKILGVFILLLGLALMAFGVWFGMWYCLVGGIADIINQVKAEETNATVIAFAIVKIIFFEAPIVCGIWVGTFTAIFGLGLAYEQ